MTLDFFCDLDPTVRWMVTGPEQPRLQGGMGGDSRAAASVQHSRSLHGIQHGVPRRACSDTALGATAVSLNAQCRVDLGSEGEPSVDELFRRLALSKAAPTSEQQHQESRLRAVASAPSIRIDAEPTASEWQRLCAVPPVADSRRDDDEVEVVAVPRRRRRDRDVSCFDAIGTSLAVASLHAFEATLGALFRTASVEHVAYACTASVTNAADVIGRAACTVGSRIYRSDTCLGRMCRLHEEEVTFPLELVHRGGAGVLVDEEHYQAPFCLGCVPEYFDALTSPVSGPHHYADVFVPSSCPMCDPRFHPRGHTSTSLVKKRCFIPTDLWRELTTQQQMKKAVPRKSTHLAATATLEAKVDLRKEALMFYWPKLLQLGLVPASLRPRWAALPVLNWLDWRRPLCDEQTHFASPWRPGTTDAITSVKVASHPAVKAQEEIDVNLGSIPSRVVDVSPTVVEELRNNGVTMNDAALTPPINGQRHFDGAFVGDRSSHGCHAAPPGPVCVYDDHTLNGLAAIHKRIGSNMASARKDSWRPTKKMKQQASDMIDFLIDRVFTTDAIRKCVIEKGCLDEMLQPKVSIERARALINEAMVDKDQLDPTAQRRTPAMIKCEATQNMTKAPRLVMDRGLKRFMETELAVTVVESLYGHFDHHINIKNRPKPEVLDELSRLGSYDHLFGDKTASLNGHVNPDSARCHESDFSTYDFSQALEFSSWQEGEDVSWSVAGLDGAEADLGILAWERRLIRHVCNEVSNVINELRRAQGTVLPTETRVDLVNKSKASKELMRAPSWRLCMYLLHRRSGDGQTSWGNRLNNTIIFATAHLHTPVKLFSTLMQLNNGDIDPEDPRVWLFTQRISQKLIYYKPCHEGDDTLLHIIGSPDAVNSLEGPASEISDKMPHSVREPLEVISKWGVTSTYLVVKEKRAEFVGCHIAAVAGYLEPSQWCPDISRGIVKGNALRGYRPEGCDREWWTKVSLAFASRAAMFHQRCDPMFNYWNSYAQEARLHANGERLQVAVDWAMAGQLGLEIGALMDSDKLHDLYAAQAPSRPLSTSQQKRLAACSLGGDITDAEWSRWLCNTCSFDMCVSDVRAGFPAVLRDSIDKPWASLGLLG